MNSETQSTGSTRLLLKSTHALMLTIVLSATLSTATLLTATGCKTRKISSHQQYEHTLRTDSSAFSRIDVRDLSVSDIYVAEQWTTVPAAPAANGSTPPDTVATRFIHICRHSNIQATRSDSAFTLTDDSLRATSRSLSETTTDKTTHTLIATTATALLAILVLIFTLLAKSL